MSNRAKKFSSFIFVKLEMIVNFKGRFLDSIDKYVIDNKESQTSLSADSVGLIVGIVLISLFLIIFVTFVSYWCPCWHFFELCLQPIVNTAVCNCVNFYDKCCPLLDQKAKAKIQRSHLNNRIYVQDMLATSDGQILQCTDHRPIDKCFSRQSLETQII